MIGYVMIGSNDLQRAADYYDRVLVPLGLAQVEVTDGYVAFAHVAEPAEIELYITKPFDQKPAAPGNGAMIALRAESRRSVDSFHAIALEHGGRDEGAPGPRPPDGGVYYAYARDHDGNKICACCPDPIGS